jgi:hypothetical protein
MEITQFNTNQSYFSGLKEVNIIIDYNNWTSCGGKITEFKIKISDDLGNECATKTKKFIVGQENVWNTKDLLSDCAKMKIDPGKSFSLKGLVLDQGDDKIDCIKFLNVVLNGGTIYKYSVSNPSSNPDKIFNGILNKD